LGTNAEIQTESVIDKVDSSGKVRTYRDIDVQTQAPKIASTRGGFTKALGGGMSAAGGAAAAGGFNSLN